MVRNGGGRHVWYLSKDQILLAEKWSYIAQVPILLVYATAKTSVALLTLRFVGSVSVWRKSLLFFIIGAVIIVNILTIILIFVQCTPSYALWEKVQGGSCWDPSIVGNFNYFSRAWNVFVDIILALLPVSFVYKLKMKQRKKIALAGLLSLGLMYVALAYPSFDPYLLADEKAELRFVVGLNGSTRRTCSTGLISLVSLPSAAEAA